jgi:hypothetical protein
VEIGIVILFVIGAVILIRALAGGLDHDRVRRYVESQGGRVLEAHWAPFGPGWFGEKSDRIYEVRYLDRHGNERLAHCKTSLFTGVYFTEDRIVGHGQRSSEPRAASLEEENRRLREEVERLRRERDESGR